MSKRSVYVLDDLTAPAEAVPALTVTTYRPGDAQVWERIVRAFSGCPEHDVSFHRQMRELPSFRAYRTCFVWRAGLAVATAAAGYDPGMLPDAGMLMFAAVDDSVDPEAALRLACSAALISMRGDGRKRAWAEAGNPLACRVLESLGFQLREVTPREVYLDHTDYQARTVPLHRWHKDRMVGESTGKTGDARGDESLYRPSMLGSAAARPSRVVAGAQAPLTLSYTAGEFPVSAGMSVVFWMAGQGSLGTAPQALDPEFPGYVEIEAPAALRTDVICDKVRVLSLEKGENPQGGLHAGDMVVGPITVGFTVTGGELRQGETVSLHIGRTSGFVWKTTGGRKEFKVMVDPGHGEPRMRLPEPVAVIITADEPHALEVLLPGSCRPGAGINGTVSVRDRFDNRVACDGPVRIAYKGGSIDTFLSQGIGRFSLRPEGPHPVTASAACADLGLRGESNPCVPGNDPQLFFGDMHTHDFLSTAEGYPADCYQWARDEKRLDFQGLPVQVHRWIDNEKWAIAKHLNEYFLEEGRFVTFLSFEWQHSQYGDKVVHYLGGDMPYLPVDDPRYADPLNLYEALRATDAFIISHHPGYALDLHVPGTRWEVLNTDIDGLAEIWSMHGSSEGFDDSDRPLIPPRRPGGVYEALRKGLRVGFVGGSDTHTARPGGSFGEPRPYFGGLCAVWARELTRRALFEAFSARRTYALTGARIVLRFTVNGRPMGAEGGMERDRRISVQAYAPDTIRCVQVMRNAQVFKEITVGDRHAEIELTDTCDDPAFYHCRVEQADGHKAVCSPVWIGYHKK